MSEVRKGSVELVVFDCDGVLVDTETLSARALVEALGPRVGLTQDDVYAHFLGRSQPSAIETLRERWGFDYSAQIREEVAARMRALMDAELSAVAGVGEAARALGLPVCVASSSDPSHIARSLARTGLAAIFEPHLFSARMVARGKPAPDLFLFAAERMGVEPSRCLVVEDSPAGVAAARAAGMAVFGFVGASHAGPAGLVSALAGRVDALFDDMRLLPALVSELRGR